MSKEQQFMKVALEIAEMSSCLRRKIGAVIVDDESHIRATGYNGPPRSFPHCVTCMRHPAQDVGDLNKLPVATECYAIHAEQNALLQCEAKQHIAAMYVNTFPCLTCAKLIANTNIKTIYYTTEYSTNVEAHCKMIHKMFINAGIKAFKWDNNLKRFVERYMQI